MAVLLVIPLVVGCVVSFGIMSVVVVLLYAAAFFVVVETLTAILALASFLIPPLALLSTIAFVSVLFMVVSLIGIAEEVLVLGLVLSFIETVLRAAAFSTLVFTEITFTARLVILVSAILSISAVFNPVAFIALEFSVAPTFILPTLVMVSSLAAFG